MAPTNVEVWNKVGGSDEPGMRLVGPVVVDDGPASMVVYRKGGWGIAVSSNPDGLQTGMVTDIHIIDGDRSQFLTQILGPNGETEVLESGGQELVVRTRKI